MKVRKQQNNFDYTTNICWYGTRLRISSQA